MNRKRRLASWLVGNRQEFFHNLGYSATFEAFFRDAPTSVQVYPESYADRKSIHDFVTAEVIGDDAIDYLEFGVFQGESIRWWTERNTNAQSRFFGFDTFTGLPEDWADKKKGDFDVEHRTPNIDDPRVQFVPGLFQESLRPFLAGFEPRDRLVLHMDADLYSSTLFCLTVLDYLICKDSVIIFDEFSSLAHEYAAFHDYCRSFNREFQLLCRTEGYEHIAFACKK